MIFKALLCKVEKSLKVYRAKETRLLINKRERKENTNKIEKIWKTGPEKKTKLRAYATRAKK